ncbi:MAG: glycosyltransferase family 4 protein [Desulfovibrio sp.]|nr:glycosyltransferase family 4 protein [Desulfovibrio sp.]
MTTQHLFVNTFPLLGEETGIGTYTRHVAEALLADPSFDPTFFTGIIRKDLQRPPACLLLARKCLARVPALKKLAKRMLRLLRGRVQDGSSPFDLYFEPNTILLEDISARRRILTIHDFSCFLHPEWHPKERVRYLETHFEKSTAQADHIITVSKAVKKEAVSEFSLDESRITAIPNGVDNAFFHPRPKAELEAILSPYGLPETFILFTGTIEPRKNIPTLIKAYLSLPPKIRKSCPLVLAGAGGWNNRDILRLIREHKGAVRFLGYVPRRVLAALYAKARIFVYPSFYEGFGLPVLEAMACGCPTLTADGAALREAAGGAALHCDPCSADSVRDGMLRILNDPVLQSSLAERGLKRASEKTWELSTKRHLDLFASLCAR